MNPEQSSEFGGTGKHSNQPFGSQRHPNRPGVSDSPAFLGGSRDSDARPAVHAPRFPTLVNASFVPPSSLHETAWIPPHTEWFETPRETWSNDVSTPTKAPHPRATCPYYGNDTALYSREPPSDRSSLEQDTHTSSGVGQGWKPDFHRPTMLSSGRPTEKESETFAAFSASMDGIRATELRLQRTPAKLPHLGFMDRVGGILQTKKFADHPKWANEGQKGPPPLPSQVLTAQSYLCQDGTDGDDRLCNGIMQLLYSSAKHCGDPQCNLDPQQGATQTPLRHVRDCLGRSAPDSSRGDSLHSRHAYCLPPIAGNLRYNQKLIVECFLRLAVEQQESQKTAGEVAIVPEIDSNLVNILASLLDLFIDTVIAAVPMTTLDSGLADSRVIRVEDVKRVLELFCGQELVSMCLMKNVKSETTALPGPLTDSESQGDDEMSQGESENEFLCIANNAPSDKLSAEKFDHIKETSLRRQRDTIYRLKHSAQKMLTKTAIPPRKRVQTLIDIFPEAVTKDPPIRFRQTHPTKAFIHSYERRVEQELYEDNLESALFEGVEDLSRIASEEESPLHD